MLTLFKKNSKQLNIIRFTLTIIVKVPWLKSEQTFEEVIKKLSMGL